MHFAAWLSVGDSVRDPAGYYRNNVVGALSVLEAMVAAGVQHFVFSSTARCSAIRWRRRSPRRIRSAPINAYGETKLAIERALPHYERAYGLRSVALRYFNAAGADPDGELGEDHDPEMHVIPRAIDAALGRGTLPGLRRRLRHAGRHLPARLRPRHRSGRRARAGARRAARRRGRPRSTTSATAGRPRCARSLDAVERVTGRPVPYTSAPAPRRRSGACCSPSSERIRRELGWEPRFEDVDTIVETAWRWRERIPQGYRATRHAR